MSDDELRKMYERQFGPFVHMGPEDKAIWLRFLMRGGTRFAPFTYDLRVGDGVPLPSHASERERKIAQALTTKRIDVLWMHDGETIICEVKKRAGSTAIGQLILYADLYRQTFPDMPPPRKLLLTDRLEPDLTSTLIANDIQYLEIGL